MTGPLILSIDCGLTATKAVLFAPDGVEKAAALEKTVVVDAGDRSEIDMAQQWKRVTMAIRGAVEAAGVTTDAIVAIGVSGHGAGLYAIDEAGDPVGRALSSMDHRAQSIVDRWQTDGVSCYARTRHHPWSGQPVPQLAWLKQHDSETYTRIRWVFSAKNWITYKLTGESSGEVTDASNSGFMNLRSGAYDREIFSTFGIADAFDKLPKLHRSSEIVGTVTPRAAIETGLKVGIPVTAGLFDVVACAAGSGVHDESRYSMIAGTWNINTAFERSLLPTEPTVKCSLGADGAHFVFVESSATSACNLEWFVTQVMMRRDPSSGASGIYARMNDEVDAHAVQSADPFYLPFLYPSHLSPDVGGCFIGIRPEHDARHLTHAIYEGVVFAHRQHLDILRRNGMDKQSAVLAGGATNSAAWCRLFSTITGLSIETSRATQVGALGAAIIAAVGAGVYGGLPQATEAMVKPGRRYEPSEPTRAAYEDRYAKYLELLALLGERSGRDRPIVIAK
ncbi:MAG TPA: FGGY-family carbohydrate kinase [Spirochaetia bacterium]|nr:FGGY-family carbohydrate kinase [Spirochaetia bacterium]